MDKLKVEKIKKTGKYRVLWSARQQVGSLVTNLANHSSPSE